MPNEPLLSIIIVAYKSRDEIGACLGSIPNELTLSSGDCARVEVLAVDNSPGDGAGEIIRRDFPWVRYLPVSRNLGFGSANNLGYAESNAKSEFVIFLNPDTICSHTALAHCMTRLREDSAIGLISPKLVLRDGSMDLACRRSIPTLWDGFCRASGLAAAFPRSKWFSGYNLTYLPEDGTYDVGAINGAFMMGRRAVFDAVAGQAEAESLELRAESGFQNGGRRSVAAESAYGADGAAPSTGDGQGLKPGLTADSLPLKAARAASPVERPELRVESPRLKADALPPEAAREARSELKADSLPLTAAAATRLRVFDERFFMYGDDLDLCIRVKRAGFRIVYDGREQITHVKGVSVAKDYDLMARAIFDANRDVYLKHFNPRGSVLVRWKYLLAFAIWKRVALWKARLSRYRKVRPA